MSAPNWKIEGRQWPNAEASRFVSAGGLNWHVQVMGSGPVLWLLHGTASGTHSWRDLMPLLAPHFTVVAPDLPGHGFTQAMARPTPAGVGAALAALVTALDLPPVLTLGHSAGAAVALTMALPGAQLGQARPQAIISLGGALLPFPGMAGKLFPALARVIFVNPLMPELFAMRARVPGEVASFLHRSTGSRIDARGLALYERLLRTSGHIGGALALMANWDLEPLERALPTLNLPILLAHGEGDKTIPAKTAHSVARRLPQAQVRILPGLGHLAHEEDPAGHAALILDFARAQGIMAA
ncbi:MAG: alpha/beta fold hydrolase BchO [Polymorphobacter sp.]